MSLLFDLNKAFMVFNLFSDVPRSRLVKYPLLIKQVLKFSECPHDCALLSSAVNELEDILKVLGERTKQGVVSSKFDFFFRMSTKRWLKPSVR